MKKFFTSEQGILVEAIIAAGLMYFIWGFEITVIAFLGFIAARVFKMSLDQEKK